MKRISIFLMVFSLCGAVRLPAQDAATEERLNKLNGLVKDLLEDKDNLRRQVENLSREVQSLREQLSKPSGDYASQEALRKLASDVKEIDDKREADKKLILKEFEKAVKAVSSSPAGRGGSRPPVARSDNPKAGGGSEMGFEHTIQSGDTLSAIEQAYRERGINVSVQQILAANPGLVPEKMPVGKKIWIPAPSK